MSINLLVFFVSKIDVSMLSSFSLLFCLFHCVSVCLSICLYIWEFICMGLCLFVYTTITFLVI